MAEKRMIDAIQGKVRVCATGTPAKSRPVELFTQLNYLAPREFPNFFSFAKRYCGAYRGSFGWDFTGASNQKELNDRLRSTVMIRRMKTDVLTDLGDKTRQVITIQATGAVKKLLKQEIEAYEAMKVSDEDTKFGVAATELAALRVMIGEQKVSHVLAHLKEVDEPTILFVRHKAVQADLAEGLRKQGKKVVIYNGDMNVNAKKEAENAFMDGEADVFIGTITACGVGLTLTKASYVVFAETEWTPSDLVQAEDRAYRQGQKGNVLVHHIVFDGSLDDHMLTTIIKKQRTLDRVLDDTDTFEGRVDEIDTKDAETGGDNTLKAALVAYETAKEGPGAPKAPKVDGSKKAAIHHCMKLLAGVCDGASSHDGQGFAKFDARFGHSLAKAESLSDKQANAALRLVFKYRKQLGNTEAFEVATGKETS